MMNSFRPRDLVAEVVPGDCKLIECDLGKPSDRCFANQDSFARDVDFEILVRRTFEERFQLEKET